MVRRQTLLDAASLVDALREDYAAEAGRVASVELRRTTSIAAATCLGIASALRLAAER
jgi:hypothetical protein